MKPTLQQAFETYFHKKYSFNDFLTIDVSSEYTSIFYSKNTYSPSAKIKNYQRFLNLFMFESMPINERVAFAYRKGVNAVDAIKPHKDAPHILTTDIKSFFSSISVDKLKTQILQQKSNALLEESSIADSINSIMNIVTFNSLLPIGAPSSPVLSNIYLCNLDNAIEKICTEKGIVFTRYSDDFIFSCESRDRLETLYDELPAFFTLLGYKGIELNCDKTKYHSKARGKILLLGLSLTHQGFITLDSSVKKEIEVLLHFYINDKDKFKNFFEKKFQSNLDKVSGTLSHINSIDPYYMDKLRCKYGNFVVNSFMHRDIANV